MKKVIVKAIVKATKADRKAARAPFYKGITAPTTTPTAPTTTPTAPTAPTTTPTVKDVYNFVLRYVVEKYPAVKPYGNTFVYSAKRFYEYLVKEETDKTINNRVADFYIYRFLWYLFSDLRDRDYIYKIGSSAKDYYRHRVINNIAVNYFNRFFMLYDVK